MASQRDNRDRVPGPALSAQLPLQPSTPTAPAPIGEVTDPCGAVVVAAKREHHRVLHCFIC